MKKVATLIFVSLIVTSVWSQIQVPSNSTSPIYYKDGNVGINTQLPSAKLDVFTVVYGGSRQSFIGIKSIVKTEDIIEQDGTAIIGKTILSPEALDGDVTRIGVHGQALVETPIPDMFGYVGKGIGIYGTSIGFGSNFAGYFDEGNVFVRNKLGLGVEVPESFLHIRNGDNSLGAILAQANGDKYQLYTKTLTAGVENGETFRIGLKRSSNESNGFISFYRGIGSSGGYLGFSTNGLERVRVDAKGHVGIGKAAGNDAVLDVAGTIRATEIKVEAQTADFVFDEDYNLRELDEVERFIKDNKHLPDIPSAVQMEAEGVNLAEMNKLLLQKVEELTLYIIDLKKENNVLKSNGAIQEAEIGNQKENFRMQMRKIEIMESRLKDFEAILFEFKRNQ